MYIPFYSKMDKSILNITKTKGVLDALVTLHNETRSKVFLIILDAEEKKKEINLTQIWEKVKTMGVVIEKQNCINHIKELEKVGLVELTPIEGSAGQAISVKPTAKAHKVKNLLYTIKDAFT